MPKTAIDGAGMKRISEAAAERLTQNKRVRRGLPTWGRLHIDRRLPFLCVYRQPPGRGDEGTERLVTGEASYLMAPGDRRHRPHICSLIRQIAETLLPGFGSFLILELWSTQVAAGADAAAPEPRHAGFRIYAPGSKGLQSTIERFERTLKRIKIPGAPTEVEGRAG